MKMEYQNDRENIIERLRWIAVVRIVAGITVFVVFAILRLFKLLDFPFLLFSIAPLIEIFVNQPYLKFVGKMKDPKRIFFYIQILDIILITWGVYFAGGMNMPVALLVYPLVFIFTGIVIGVKRSYFMANFAFFMYASMVLLESTGVIPVVTDINVQMDNGTRFMLTVLVWPFFNLIAFYASYLSNMILKNEKQLREAQARVARAEKLTVLGKFAGMIAHELRGPLGVIRNSIYYMRTLLADKEIDEKVTDILQLLNKETDISERIINDTLTFARLKEAHINSEDVNKIIWDIIKRMEIPEGVNVVTDLDKNMPEIMADRVQIRMVLNNIISNALESLPDEKGCITITSRAKKDHIEISISDTGIGIPEENLKEIFEPLFSTKSAGTGFGLSICHSIIKMHRGNIDVKSEVGKGSLFTITLPVA